VSTEQNKALVRQLVEEVFNRGNVSRVDEFMAPDFVDHEGVPGYPPTREGFKQSIPMLRSGMPDFNATIDDVVAEGDRVVIRMTWRGTQTGEFMGMSPTGKSISVGVIDIFRIAGGKVVEHWGLMDSMAMMQQLGAMPAPGHS